MRKIINGKLITDKIEEGKNLYTENGKIVAVTEKNLPCDEVLDANGNYVSPGFVDIHCHGGFGYEFTDSYAEYTDCLRQHFAHGTTCMVPTCSAASDSMMRHFLDNVRASMNDRPNGIPQICGGHLEGPYLSAAQCGAQNTQLIRPPEKAEYEALLRDYAGYISRWSYAPENPGSVEFARALQAAGVVGSLAHTDAVLEDVQAVFAQGTHLLTHFYSCMSTVTRRNAYRRLGVIESGYLLDGMDIELIADGHHLPVDLLQLILKLKDHAHIALITDSVRGLNAEGKVSDSFGTSESVPYVVKDGVAFVPDFSCFAGSVATTDVLVRTVYQKVGLSLPESVRMVTVNPLRMMGITGKGRLAPGYDADVVIFDEDIQVKHVLAANA